VKISANISVSKYRNIGIGGQSNIGNWPNIGKKLFENISIDFNKILVGLLHEVGQGDCCFKT